MARLARAARRAWPELALDPEVFCAYVAARVQIDSSEELRRLQWDELYLSCACQHGDRRAQALFEARYFPGVVAALARMGLDGARIDELAQQLRAQLFVTDRGRPPRIGSYAGRGPLAAWLRVSAVRAALKEIRRERRERATEDDRLEELSAGGGDAEVHYLKRLYGPLFRESFIEVFTALGPREKNLLRQHYLDGLTLGQIGRLHRLDRGTVARWLDRIRRTLLDETRRSVMQRVRLPQAGCDSLIRFVRSQLDVSLCELLGDSA